MRVLVTGANGFIGAHVVAALGEAGHETVGAVRAPSAASIANGTEVACDFARDLEPQIWLPRLAGIEAVVNCAGILRETRHDTFRSVHVDAPIALFRACAMAGARRVIQLSALGEPDDGEFIASKHRADQALSELDLDWLVLRPGLVYSAHGAYGGTRLLRAIAALPGVLVVPGDGRQELRPVAAGDLAAAVVAALTHPQRRGEIVEIVGPEILALRDYLLAWREWFGLRTAAIVTVPRPLVDFTVAWADRYGNGPLCRVIANLLERRRVGGADAPQRTRALLGRAPLALAAVLAQRPCQAQDLLAARWYMLRHFLLCAIALLFIGSGLVGHALALAAARATLPDWPPALVEGAKLAGGMADLGLGLLLLTGRARRTILALMLVMVVGYTMVIGASVPAHWLDPLGGLLKNLPIAAILIVLLAMEPRRR
ncbi:MAG TPA: NAD-dependent epimerase/dehydratase family protein [Rudaea sp.]|nr:NAD-dependent epimerase/dehydratase family protein [Rudaea sp.]